MKTPTYTLTAALSALTPILFLGNVDAALVSYLSLDDSTGLTLTNGAAITSSSQGKFGEALNLDGTNDYAVVTTGNPVTGTGARTTSAWVYQNTGATGLKTVLSFGNNGTGTKWDVDIDNGNGIEVGIGGGRMVDTGLSAGLTGTWVLVVTTLPTAGGNIQAVRTYFNGSIRTNTTTQTTAVNTASTGEYRLGTLANPPPTVQFFNGRIDDVGVWNEALTAGEIRGLYDVGLRVNLAYTAFDFDLLKQRHDAATGSTIIDGLEWTYATGLTGSAGLTLGTGGYTLILDAGAGTGLTAIPEPSAALLGGFGLLALLRRRNR